MKKSKIILPAVALLTISTVAAASSTVAWFTAGRSVTVSGSTVAVYNPESSLKVTLGAVTDSGSTVDNTAGAQRINLPTHMRDGSVNASTGKIYRRDIVDENKYYEAKYTEDKAIITGTDATDIYRATSWTMTFKMDAGATDSYAILLDTKVKSTVANEEGTAYKSFRIAFVADGNVAIYAPFVETAGEDTYNYVKSLTGTTAEIQSYKENVIDLKAEKQASQITSTAADALKPTNGLIGTIPAKNGNAGAGLVVTCYAWFEGEDPNCVVTNGVAGDITTALGFYAVRVKTAA